MLGAALLVLALALMRLTWMVEKRMNVDAWVLVVAVIAYLVVVWKVVTSLEPQ